MALLRWITAILVVCAALPASALSAVVDRDTVTGSITISGSSVSSGDEITITTTGTSHVIRDPNGVTAPEPIVYWTRQRRSLAMGPASLSISELERIRSPRPGARCQSAWPGAQTMIV